MHGVNMGGSGHTGTGSKQAEVGGVDRVIRVVTNVGLDAVRSSASYSLHALLPHVELFRYHHPQNAANRTNVN